ncbi:MAG: AAA family ATPase [Bacilli bacterium]
MVKKNRYNRAILLEKIDIDDEEYYLYPKRILFGNLVGDKKDYFYDALSDRIYHNIVNDGGENEYFCILPSKEKTKNANDKAALSLLDNMKKYICVCNSIDKTGVIISSQEFYETYDMIPKNEYLNDYARANGNKISLTRIHSDKKEFNIFDYSINDLISSVKRTVIAQDDAVKTIITAIYKNLVFGTNEMKSNILICGPTGCGKTEIIRSVSKVIGVPVLIEDITRYTPSGYVGGDIDNILYKLYLNANEDLGLAQRSILVLDEIDKKVDSEKKGDSFKKDVLNSLLKIIEGGVFDIKTSSNKRINFDTSKLTIIVCGAFSDLLEKRENSIGFSPDKRVNNYGEISNEDLIKYGIPPEFIGRINVFSQVKELAKDDLVRILNESDKSPLLIYKNSLSNIGVEVNINDQIIDKIASLACSKKTGARALKLVTDSVFESVLFDIFSSKEKDTLVVDFNDENGNYLRKKI